MPRLRVVLSLGLPDPDRLSTTLLWSLLGHAGLLIGVLIYQNLPSHATTRDAPYFVRLTAPTSPAGGGARSPASPVRPAMPIEKPAEKPPAPKPPPAKASLPAEKVEKTPRKPVPAESAREATGPAHPSGRPEPAAQTEGHPGPPGGATGGVGGAGVSFGEGLPYDPYQGTVIARLTSVWSRPLAASTEDQTVTVSFSILRNGAVKEVAIVTPSGNPLLDVSAVRAVGDAAPFPVLPKDYGDSVRVTITFQLKPGEP